MSDGVTSFSRPGGATLHVRGMTIRLEADDPRLAVIEVLLFGRPLPPPVPLPATTAAPESVVPPETSSAPVEVPPAWLRFWRSLPDEARRMLGELAREALTTPQLEARLGVDAGRTRALTIMVAAGARAAGLASPLEGVGHGRAARRRQVVEEARPIVLELERRWEKVAEAVARAER